jgi:uncharacterized membrane-anchored protein YhcB (DUF1043 family)
MAEIYINYAICFVIGILVGWIVARVYSKKVEQK